MDETPTYHIKMRNGVDEMALNAAAPVQVVVCAAQAGTTLLHTHTDQSGLIGLLRYLHQQGYVLLAITREPQGDEQ